MKNIQNQSEYDQLVNQSNPILLDFYADWCGPCQTLLPIVDKLSNEYKGTVEIRKVNVDENQELAAQFKVRSIPALFFIKDNQIVDRVNGVVPEGALRTKLNALIA
ncbi:MAG: thioredoxin [Crocinitomicaceae bacterium]|nr:thioredoxin [Flavobacteriales bacterium]NQZ37113.1 thioredoxin [Crocinitomicaceae bacterium]